MLREQAQRLERRIEELASQDKGRGDALENCDAPSWRRTDERATSSRAGQNDFEPASSHHQPGRYASPLLEFMALFHEFRAPSWAGWRSVLARVTSNVREFYAIVGRGAGKSRVVGVNTRVFLRLA